MLMYKKMREGEYLPYPGPLPSKEEEIRGISWGLRGDLYRGIAHHLGVIASDVS
jgi:hypothetical protein